MKTIISVVILLVLCGAAFSGTESITLSTSEAVGLSESTMQTYKNNDKSCLCTIEGTDMRITFTPSSAPTTTQGHKIIDGNGIVLVKDTVRDEISNFRAIASSGTGTLTCSCD